MFLNKIEKFIKISFRKKILLFEALFWLPLTRGVIQFVPMKIYTPVFLGKLMAETEKIEMEEKDELFSDIRWALNVVSNRMPWKNKCFALAMSAKMILRYRKIESTLYLGLAKKSEHNLGAHAWIRAGNFYVTGGNGTGYKI